jgi:outer membrane protein TolC
MKRIQTPLAALCAILMLPPLTFAQDQTPKIEEPSIGIIGTRKYMPEVVPPVELQNSPRLDSLLRGGNLYLALQDAIALALENNIDIAVDRYGPAEAEQDLRRAKSGGALRGVNTAVTNGPSSVAPISLSAFSTNTTQTTGAITSSSTSVNGIIAQLGPTIPNYDPVLTGTISYGHNTLLQTSGFLNGQDIVLGRSTVANFSVQEGFATGGTASLTFNNSNAFQNTGRLDVNPFLTSNLQLLVSQPLLNGFGIAINNRLIRQAKNSLKIQDYVFKQQVETTIANIVNLYWDLVSFNEQVKVAAQALAASQKLYNDNKKQVEVGTLAPISVVQAEAEIATNEQNLTVAQTNVLEQETILKNVLSRQGISSPAVANAHIITLDRIRVPDVEPVQPIQDVTQMALDNRPEVPQSRLGIENSKITIQGDRNNLLPQLNAFGLVNNNCLAGSANPFPAPGTPASLIGVPNLDPTFAGGYGTCLSQVFSRNYPDYRIGLSLTIPLRNRAAQSDYVRDSMTLRQGELGLQKQINQIRVDVQNAVIALQQARAQYQAAQKSVALEVQTLEAEQKKYALGASTVYNVILIQRDLLTAQGNQVNAESNYVKAKNNIDFVTGLILQSYNVDLGEAYRGQVSKPPSPIPVIEPGTAAPPPGARGSK